jgi:hypothetical protein
MLDWLWFIAFFAGYIVLMRWVLPRLVPPDVIRVASSLDAKVREQRS